MIDELTIYNLAVEYPNTVDLVRKVEQMARADAFLEIAYSDCVEKEPFEALAYQKGRADAVEEFRTYLKSVIPIEMPQEIWNMGVDNTCDRMLKGAEK